MTKSRREFLNTGVKAGAAVSVLGSPAFSPARAPWPDPSSLAREAPHPLRILILGGTSFLGPHQIAYALSRGHSLSIFTRGRTEPTVHQELYENVGRLIGEATELVLEVPEGIDEEQQMEYGFGVMKANSEIEARREFGADRTITVRPTYMMGPADRTDRFAYWPVRLGRAR